MSLTRTYEYPVKGIHYFVTHRRLWPRVLLGMVMSSLTSLAVYIIFFAFVFPSQSQGLSGSMSKVLAWSLSFLLTLYEIQILMMIISTLTVSYLMTTIFDTIWINQANNLNENDEQQSQPSEYRSCLKTFATLMIVRVLLFVISYPLNIIPILGTILFVYINAYYYGWSLHIRYFDRIGLTYRQGKHYVKQHRSSYTKYGVVAMIFDLIPILNFVSPTTNVIGSALWAGEIDKHEDPSTHPRSYLISPSQNLIQQQNDYGSIANEKQPINPPNYEQVVQENLSPSAPPSEKQ